MKLLFLLLAVTCHANVTGPINVSVNAATYDMDNAAKVNTFGWGLDVSGGVNRRIRVDSNGMSTVMDYYTLASRGMVDGVLTVHKFGNNPAIVGVTEDIWATGGTYAGFITYSAQVRVKAGGNAADTAAGAGARTVYVEGLDQNFSVTSTTLTLAGASASSASGITFSRVYRAYVLTSGTYHAANTGAVVIETDTAVVMTSIPAGAGQTQMSMYTVPAGYTAWLVDIHTNVSPSNGGTVSFYQNRDADDVTASYTGKRLIWSNVDTTGSDEQTFKSQISFPAKTDLWAEGIRITGGGNMAVTITYDLILVPN